MCGPTKDALALMCVRLMRTILFMAIMLHCSSQKQNSPVLYLLGFDRRQPQLITAGVKIVSVGSFLQRLRGGAEFSEEMRDRPQFDDEEHNGISAAKDSSKGISGAVNSGGSRRSSRKRQQSKRSVVLDDEDDEDDEDFVVDSLEVDEGNDPAQTDDLSPRQSARQGQENVDNKEASSEGEVSHTSRCRDAAARSQSLRETRSLRHKSRCFCIYSSHWHRRGGRTAALRPAEIESCDAGGSGPRPGPGTLISGPRRGRQPPCQPSRRRTQSRRPAGGPGPARTGTQSGPEHGMAAGNTGPPAPRPRREAAPRP